MLRIGDKLVLSDGREAIILPLDLKAEELLYLKCRSLCTCNHPEDIFEALKDYYDEINGNEISEEKTVIQILKELEKTEETV